LVFHEWSFSRCMKPAFYSFPIDAQLNAALVCLLLVGIIKMYFSARLGKTEQNTKDVNLMIVYRDSPV